MILVEQLIVENRTWDVDIETFGRLMERNSDVQYIYVYINKRRNLCQQKKFTTKLYHLEFFYIAFGYEANF